MSKLVPGNIRRRAAAVASPGLLRHGRRLLQGETAPQRALRVVSGRVSARRIARLRARQASDAPLVAVAVDGRAMLAHVPSGFQAGAVYAEQAAAVADAFEAAGVDYFYLSIDPARRRVLVVAAGQRSRAMRALESRLDATTTYVAPVYNRTPGRPRALGGRGPRFTSTLRIFQYLATASGLYVSGAEMGCDVQFWREADARTPVNSSGEPLLPGSLIGERTLDRVPEIVDPIATSVSRQQVDRRERPALTSLAHPHLLQVVDPVDIVYTWVDGSDPAWQQRKEEALGGLTDPRLHALAANASRYASRDELRYSLRSVDMYASWVRHIYLVSDDQVPPWLDVDNPKITVVSHRDLFADRGRLPTFNSHAIESQLHHIDGLAENYLYFNDDVFLGRPCTPDQFVLGNGLAKFFLSSVKVGPGPVRPDDLPITAAAKNNRDLLVDKFGRMTTHKFQHAPYSLRRSVMLELENLFADEVAATAAAQFRSPGDLSMAASLGHYYGFLTGRAVPGRLRYLYADIARSGTPERLELLLRHRDHDAFCLNDHDSSHLSTQAQTDLVHGFLQRYFPLPSQFER